MSLLENGYVGCRAATKFRHMRGYTIIELIVVVTLVAVVVGFAMLAGRGVLDRVAVAQGRERIVAFYNRSRTAALLNRSIVTLRISTDSLVARTRSGMLMTRAPGTRTLGVTTTATRDTVRIGINGLGYGASNSTVVLERGAVSDTLFISRLGRIRR